MAIENALAAHTAKKKKDNGFFERARKARERRKTKGINCKQNTAINLPHSLKIPMEKQKEKRMKKVKREKRA